MDAGGAGEEDGDAVAAFEALRAEVAAVAERVREMGEHLTSVRGPDYAPTLGKLAQQVEMVAVDVAGLRTRSIGMSEYTVDRRLVRVAEAIETLDARLMPGRSWRDRSLPRLRVLAGAVLLVAQHAPARWGRDAGLATWLMDTSDHGMAGYRLLGWDAEQVQMVGQYVRLGRAYARDLLLCEAQAAVEQRRVMTCNVAMLS